MNKQMQAALEADGEKLRALTGEDHGPWEVLLSECAPPEPMKTHVAYTQVEWTQVDYDRAYGRYGKDAAIEAPFDGKPVIILTTTGIIEAWWDKGTACKDCEGFPDGDGWDWVCYDDALQEDLESAKYWMPLPAIPEGFGK